MRKKIKNKKNKKKMKKLPFNFQLYNNVMMI